MRFDVITLFPEMFSGPFHQGVVGAAVQCGQVSIEFINPRDFTSDIHRTVDDRPYGGGAGMVMLAEPLEKSVEEARRKGPAKTVVFSAQGNPLNMEKIRKLSEEKHLILVCGRYEGIDQRFIHLYADAEISIGDYVISGGELAAMVLMDAVSRLLPGVLGNADSIKEESFSGAGLEYPQFTRPPSFKDLPVPEILLGGNHQAIRRWRHLVGLLKTRQQRPDLVALLDVPTRDWEEAARLAESMSPEERFSCGLKEKEP